MVVFFRNWKQTVFEEIIKKQNKYENLGETFENYSKFLQIAIGFFSKKFPVLKLIFE